MVQIGQWCQFLFLQDQFLHPVLTLPCPLDLTSDQVLSVPLSTSASWFRSWEVFLKPMSFSVACVSAVTPSLSVQHSTATPCVLPLWPSLRPQCLRFPRHPPSLHPVKLLALLSLGSKPGMVFPSFPAFPAQLTFQMVPAPSRFCSIPRIPSCSVFTSVWSRGPWGVRPPGPQHLAVCPARRRCSLGNICWFCWRNRKGFFFLPTEMWASWKLEGNFG